MSDEKITIRTSRPVQLWSELYGGGLHSYGDEWRYAIEPDEADNSEEPRTVRSCISTGCTLPPAPLEEFIAWFRDRAKMVPEPLRQTVEVHIHGEDMGDEPQARISITYRRPETPDEIVRRRAIYAINAERWARRLAYEEEQGRAEFERLRAKYGDDR